MLIAIVRLIILGFSAYGLYTAMMLIEKKWDKKVALIVTLTLGGFVIMGLLL